MREPGGRKGLSGTRSPKGWISLPREKWLPLAPIVLFIPAVLFLAYRWNPRFSHHLAETFSVIVACSVFMLTWNARKFIDNHYFIFLGIAYLFVGVIDYLHALSFDGVFTSEGHNRSIELWFAARFLQSLALLSAPLFVSRKTRPWLVFSGFAAVSTALVVLAWTGVFPDYYVPGRGLTTAKNVSDHLVAGIQILSIGTLWRVRRHFDRDVFQLLVLSILFSIVAQLSANLYTDAYEYNSIAGHYLTVVSFYLLYKAIIVIGLNRPYDLLFREMKRSEEEIRVARDELETRVTERTEALRVANVRLERELSERIRMEKERGLTSDLLRESENRFRSLVENEPVGTMIVQEGRIAFRNPELERLMGPIPEGFDFRRLGSPHPEDVPKFERLCRTVREGEPFRQGLELRFSVPDVETRQTVYRWVQCRTVPIDFLGKTAVLVNMVDITRIKDLEQIVMEREKLASLGHLAAGIAHEIRNPLSGININISTLDLLCRRAEGMDPEEKEKLHAVVAQAKAASDKIGAVVKRIMDYSKPIPPRMDRIDVVQVIREALAISEASIRKGEVKLLQDLPAEPLYCRADATLLEQVILNLITNALQAMATVDREKFLRVDVAREGQQVVIRIIDNGPGVPGDLLGKIFDPFYTTRKDGHGIGLSFSHRVISKHNGRLSAGAAEGGGAVFWIELPPWRDRRTA
jgi:PAS domain S-box-containing protein